MTTTNGGSRAEAPATGLAEPPPRREKVVALAKQAVAAVDAEGIGWQNPDARADAEHVIANVIDDHLDAFLDARQPAVANWLDLKDEADESQWHKDAGLHYSARQCTCGKWHYQEDAGPQPAVDVDALADDLVDMLDKKNWMTGLEETHAERGALAQDFVTTLRAHLAQQPPVVEALVAELETRLCADECTAMTCNKNVMCGLARQLIAKARQAQGAE